MMDLKETEKRVFEYVRDHSGVIRSELSNFLEVSKSTAERITRNLLAQKLIREQSSSKYPGRSGVGLEVNGRAWSVLAIEFRLDCRIHCAALNLLGEVLVDSEQVVSPDSEKESLLEIIISQANAVAGKARTKGYRVLGIGFGDPGFVDSLNGITILSSTYPKWRDVHVRRKLQNALSLPVYVQDASCARCLAEARYGSGTSADSFIYVELNTGVGMGIYSNNRLYRGEQGCGCEFGHMIVDPDGPLCGCGNRGCLEAIVGCTTVRNEVIEALNNGTHSLIPDLNPGDIAEITIDHIFEAALRQDRLSLSVLDAKIKILGTVLGNVCNLLNPSLVILGGKLSEYAELFNPLEAIIRRTSLPFISKQLGIAFSSLPANSGVLGPAELVIENVLYPQVAQVKS